MSYADSLRTHGRKADMLFAVSPGANNTAIIEAIESANEREMSVVLLSAANDDLISGILGPNDVTIATSVFSGRMSTTAQLQAIQCICKLIDDKIFGGD
jgi:D-sedoheptulose 7-phosphate isomerase